MSQEFKNIVRISGKNLDGDRKLINAISNLKGIGDNLSYIILKSLNLNTNLRIGSVSDKEISLIESKLKIIHELDFPKWILNRRKDMDTGQDKHYVGSDLDFNIKLLLDSEKNMGSRRGLRHMYGLRVRGQRTRTTGRKGRKVVVTKTDMQKGKGKSGE